MLHSLYLSEKAARIVSVAVLRCKICIQTRKIPAVYSPGTQYAESITQIAEANDENTPAKRFEREDLRVNEKSLGGNTLAVLPSRLDNV